MRIKWALHMNAPLGCFLFCEMRACVRSSLPRLHEAPLYMLFSSACWRINRQCKMSNPRGSPDWLTDSIRSHCLQRTGNVRPNVCVFAYWQVCECVDGGIPFLWNSLESRDCSHGNIRMGYSLVTKKKGGDTGILGRSEHSTCLRFWINRQTKKWMTGWWSSTTHINPTCNYWAGCSSSRTFLHVFSRASCWFHCWVFRKWSFSKQKEKRFFSAASTSF